MDMTLFYLLAETQPAAPSPGAAMPEWLNFILGPLGALVLLLVYAWYTEKRRIPKFQSLIEGFKADLQALQVSKDSLMSTHSIKKDSLRSAFDDERKELETKIEEWRDRHTKEKAVRAWYQAKAQALAEDAGEQLGPPPDIDRTHYG